CHQHAPQVEPSHTDSTELTEQEAADERADDPEEDVEDNTPTPLVYNLARDEAGDQAQHDPTDNGHSIPPLPMVLAPGKISSRFGCEKVKTVPRRYRSRTWSWRSKTSDSAPSYRSAQMWFPLVVSMSWPAIRTRAGAEWRRAVGPQYGPRKPPTEKWWGKCLTLCSRPGSPAQFNLDSPADS